MKVVPGAALALCLAVTHAIAAQSAAPPFPQRPIRLIVPTAPGGPLDVIARTVGPGMADVLGQQIVVDNRAGAGGLIGTETVAKAPADGYTLLLGVSGLLFIVPKINASATYTHADFAPVSLIATMPMLLLVVPSLPAKTVPELVALAKSRPGQLNYASGGVGTGIHVGFELFNLVAGVKITHVPYKGANPAMTALLGGEADMMFNGLPLALPVVKQGRLRALATGGRKRSELLPSVPTVAESGLNYEYSAWYSVVAPRGTPQAVVAKLHGSIQQALARADIKERLTGQGVDIIGSTPSEFAAFLQQENARVDKVVDATGLRARR